MEDCVHMSMCSCQPARQPAAILRYVSAELIKEVQRELIATSECRGRITPTLTILLLLKFY